MLHDRSRRSRPLVLGLVLLLGAAAPAAGAEPAQEETSDGAAGRDTLYAMGVVMGRQLTPLSVSEAELDALVEGLRDGALGRPVRVEPTGHREQIAALRRRRLAEAVEREREASQRYLAEAASREGVVRTDSGLLYEELVAGSGASPDADDTVEVHYHGTLRDGAVFDSSVQRGGPARFPLERVVRCWREGLGRMKVGGKARLVCPPSLGYGDRGVPPRIPGAAALTFEVELLGIVEPPVSQKP